MNETKRAYLLRFHRFQKSREEYYAPHIFAALRSQYNTMLHHLSNGLNEHQAILKIDSDQIVKILKNLYVDAATVYGAKVRSDLNRLMPRRLQNPNSFNQFKSRLPMGFSEDMRRLIEQYFALDILNDSEGITETTKNEIRRIFTEAYAAGEGIDQIVAQLKDTGISKSRSKTIARTETVTAANAGALMVAKSTGLDLNKEWLSANDNRVRFHHREENGKVVGLNDYFNVAGYDMTGPGDRGGKNGKLVVPPELTINCRCTTIFVPLD